MKQQAVMEKREWKWLIAATVLVLLLSSIPYAVGYNRQNAQTVFGGAVLNRPDYDVYVADIQSGLRGIAYYPMLHSPEDVRPVYLRLFYVWVGLLGRGTSLSAYALFQIARWICGAAALVTMYLFAARFFRSVRLRRFAWLIFVFGSGFGWLMVLFHALPASGIAPADFSQIELYGFLSILLTPHFALTEALQWGLALAFLNGWSDSPRGNRWLAAGIVCAVAAQTIQLFAPLTVDIALAAYALWNWLRRRRVVGREAVSLLILALVQLPWAAYSLWVFRTDPVWQSYYNQNLVLSPPPIDHILGLGIVGLLAFWGMVRALAFRKLGRWHLLTLWVVVIAVATYWPSPFQRRFVAGGMGPIALLAALGVVRGVLPLARRLARRSLARRHSVRNLGLAAILILVSQSTLWFAAGITATVAGGLPIYFDTADERDAMGWLDAHSNWQDPIFTSEETGNIIPAAIGHRVYAGHWAETTDYSFKLEEIKRFFQPETSDGARRQILMDCGCRYVLYGPRERKIGSVNLMENSFLHLVYQNTTVQVYEIVPP